MAPETTTPEEDQTRTWLRDRYLPIAIGLTVFIVAAALAGFLYWRNLTLYVTTDNALVDSNMTAIASPGMGTLKNWQVTLGMQLRADQVVGFVQPAPSAASSSTFKIRTPVEGTVIRVDGKEGQVIGPTQPLAFVADLDNLSITAYIDESDIQKIKIGQSVDVTVDATGNNTYSGTVRDIMPATASEFSLIQTTDRTTSNFTKVGQSVEVHIDLDNTGNSRLFPGMSASVRIHLKDGTR